MIEADGYGVICDDNPSSMAEAIAKMADMLEQCRLRIAQTFMAKHSWEARVEKVKETLVGASDESRLIGSKQIDPYA